MRTGLAIALVAALAVAAPAFADPDAAHPWDATWVGGWDDGGDGVQLIVAGNAVVGFYFHGDYIADAAGALAEDGTLTVTWTGGAATLRREGPTAALTIRETGKPERIIKVMPE